jgi:hypothetical protein
LSLWRQEAAYGKNKSAENSGLDGTQVFQH